MSFFATFADLVGNLAHALQPVFHTSATAAAIVLFTMLVRLLVHPLSRAAARGQRAQTRLSPRIAELRHRHRKNPEKLQKAMMELYAEEKVSPLAGCLPSLLQLPAFFLLYRIFSSPRMGGQPNALLGHTLFGSPLGGRLSGALTDGGLFGARGLVYLGLFAVVAVVATFNYRKTKRTMAANGTAAGSAPGTSRGGAAARNGSRKAPQGSEGPAALAAVAKAMPLMSFATLITVAVVPLAAALYVVTSTTWSAVERAMLHRETPAADSTTAPTKDGASQNPRARARTGAAPAQGASASAAPAQAGRLARALRTTPFPRTTRFSGAAALSGPAAGGEPAEGSKSTPA